MRALVRVVHRERPRQCQAGRGVMMTNLVGRAVRRRRRATLRAWPCWCEAARARACQPPSAAAAAAAGVMCECVRARRRWRLRWRRQRRSRRQTGVRSPAPGDGGHDHKAHRSDVRAWMRARVMGCRG
eukprot:6178243-Pleurochrysis_carterae.AAC.2